MQIQVALPLKFSKTVKRCHDIPSVLWHRRKRALGESVELNVCLQAQLFYGSPKGTSTYQNFCNWEFVLRKWEFVFSKLGVCFRKWEFVFSKMEFVSLKLGVCFLFLKNGVCFFKSGSFPILEKTNSHFRKPINSHFWKKQTPIFETQTLNYKKSPILYKWMSHWGLRRLTSLLTIEFRYT